MRIISAILVSFILFGLTLSSCKHCKQCGKPNANSGRDANAGRKSDIEKKKNAIKAKAQAFLNLFGKTKVAQHNFHCRIADADDNNADNAPVRDWNCAIEMMCQSRKQWANDINNEYNDKVVCYSANGTDMYTSCNPNFSGAPADDRHRTNAESDRKEVERLRPEAESRLAKIRNGNIDLNRRHGEGETDVELATRKKKLIRTLGTLERLMSQADAAWEDLVAVVDAYREAVK